MYGKEVMFNNPALFPEQKIVDEYFEPFVVGTIITPGETTLCKINILNRLLFNR
jgi:translation elongation factor EF-4